MRSLPKNVQVRGDLVYYRWKVGGRDHYERMPAFDSPSFGTAYETMKALRRPGQRRPASPIRAAKVRAFNRSSEGRDRPDRKIPSWMLSLAREARKRATKRQFEFSLTVRDLSLLVRRAAGRCEVSGMHFDLSPSPNSLYRPFAPSLDRIDPKAGYTLANVRITTVIVNAALNQWGEGPFWAMISAASELRGGTLGVLSSPFSEEVLSDAP